MKADNNPVWGTYAPNSKTRFLRLLTLMGFGRGKIRAHIIHRWISKFGSIVDVQRRGIKYRLDISNNVTDGQILASSIIYDRNEIEALSDACRNGVFVDIGANIGYYALNLSMRGAKKILAIEPNPPTLKRLQYNVAINHLDSVITILPIGIGSEEGEFELFSSGDLGSASLLRSPVAKTSSVKIKTRPLFNVIRDLNIVKIDGLKIDVEGMEDQALIPFFDNAPNSLWPKCMVIEHSSGGYWKKDLGMFLVKAGYVEVFRTRGNIILKLGK